jgi:uncharacterized protein YuzE
MIIVNYDEANNSAMIYLDGPIESGAVASSYACDPVDVDGMINLDFDASGRLIGIEVLGARSKLPEAVLRNAKRG